MGALKRLFNLSTQFKKIHADIIDNAGTIAINEFKGNFRKQGFNGKRWSTRKAKDKKGESWLILVKTGNLLRSIHVRDVNRDTITIIADAKSKAGFQYGGVLNKGNKDMEARPFMGDMPTLKAKIKAMIDRKMKALGK